VTPDSVPQLLQTTAAAASQSTTSQPSPSNPASPAFQSAVPSSTPPTVFPSTRNRQLRQHLQNILQAHGINLPKVTSAMQVPPSQSVTPASNSVSRKATVVAALDGVNVPTREHTPTTVPSLPQGAVITGTEVGTKAMPVATTASQPVAVVATFSSTQPTAGMTTESQAVVNMKPAATTAATLAGTSEHANVVPTQSAKITESATAALVHSTVATATLKVPTTDAASGTAASTASSVPVNQPTQSSVASLLSTPSRPSVKFSVHNRCGVIGKQPYNILLA